MSNNKIQFKDNMLYGRKYFFSHSALIYRKFISNDFQAWKIAKWGIPYHYLLSNKVQLIILVYDEKDFIL